MTCFLCGSTQPGYCDGIGSYCPDCYWALTHDENGYLIKIPSIGEEFTLSEWLQRLSIRAKQLGK